jgi:outer membrane protein assembly factor BamB
MFYLIRNFHRVLLAFAAVAATVVSGRLCAAPPEPQAPVMCYAPPEATFGSDNQLQLLQKEVDQKQFTASAARVETLLRDSEDALLVPSGDQTKAQGEDIAELSIGQWIENLPASTKNLLRPAYEAAFGAAGRRALEEAKADPEADPRVFYALARRYPLSGAAAAAFAEGARRSALLGDRPAARWMLSAAVADGWTPDAAPQGHIAQASPPSKSYCGPLPFDASWYGLMTRQGWASLRSFPAAVGDAIFVVGPGQVIALKQSGEVLWKGPIDAQPRAGRGASAPIGVTRGPPFAPALFCDASGVPQIVVVRQPQLHADGWALRALRANDGKLLWTTEGQDDFHGLVFGSNPVIEGRYVYAVAGEIGDQLDHLCLVAVELTTGRQLWRCDMGTQSRMIAQGFGLRFSTGAYRPWLNESAPVVAGDLIIASPDVGAVIAAGRFDGKLRWTRGYPTLADPTVTLQQQRNWAIEHPASVVPLASGLSLRWANTPAVSGDVVLTAPEDTGEVIALNLRDGTPIWNSADFPAATLVGIGGGAAVMAGEKIAGLNLASGKMLWTYDAQPILGPCVLHGDMILLPTDAGTLALSARDGLPARSAESVPDFQSAIAAEPARGVLLANDVAHCFASPDARRGARLRHDGQDQSP